jgi:hypothetical protein
MSRNYSITVKKQAANKEGLPVGEVISNAVKYFKFNQPCTADQALAWAALEDLSTSFAVDILPFPHPRCHYNIKPVALLLGLWVS